MKMRTLALLRMAIEEEIMHDPCSLPEEDYLVLLDFLARFEQLRRELSDLERAVLTLHFERGLPLAQISRMASAGRHLPDQSLSALRRARHSLLEKFRRCFKDIAI